MKFRGRLNYVQEKTLYSRGILSLRWLDKDVYIISTKHSRAEIVDTGNKKIKKGGEEEDVLKRSCVVEYNRGMGGSINKTNFFHVSHLSERVSKDIK